MTGAAVEENDLPDKESDLLFEIAIGRNPENVRPGQDRRVAVEMVWRSMADGTADCYEREEWLSHIAKRIVKEVIDIADEKDKGSAALSAVGLLGRRVDDTELINALQSLLGFADLISPGGKLSLADKVRLLRPGGHFEGLSDAQAKSKIKNLLQNRLQD